MISMAPITTPGKIRLATTVEEWQEVMVALAQMMPGAVRIIDRAISGADAGAWTFIEFDEAMGRMILRSTGASA